MADTPHPSFGNLTRAQVEQLRTARMDGTYEQAKKDYKDRARVKKKRKPKLTTEYIFSHVPDEENES